VHEGTHSPTGPVGSQGGPSSTGGRRALTVGLMLTVTLVALESLAIATVMPEVRADLGGYSLYGWVFSGFFLSSLVGIVVGGVAADRGSLVIPFGGGLIFFSAGLVVAGLAPNMGVLVVGRLLQGLGAGAVPAASYAAIARAFTSEERPRMFAMLSTAWVVPGLVGPAAAAAIEQALSWRWVFLGLLPVVGVAGTISAGPLSRVRPPRGEGEREADHSSTSRLAKVGLLVVGVGAVFGATSSGSAPVMGAVGLGGMVLGVWAFMGLVPPGTARAAPGIPATIAVRGLLTWSFFQADAYVSLLVIEGRGRSTFLAGAALSAGSVLWAVGSWVQARQIGVWGPRTLVGSGLAVMVVALTLATSVALGAPVVLIVVAWGVGGVGVGLAYSPLSVVVLAAARPGEEGAASASLQLCDVLGVAVGTGVGGAVVAAGADRGWQVSSSVALAFGFAVVVGIVAMGASRRIPAQVPATTLAAGQAA